MQNSNLTSTQSLMDRYYEEEKAQQERELTLAALSVYLDANDLAMLNIISKRFRKTRDDVAQELLSSALIDLFSRLEAGERKLIARDADEAARSIAEDIAEDNGVRNLDIKAGVWANHERQFTKLERKLAKLAAQEEAEKEELETDQTSDEVAEQDDNTKPTSTYSTANEKNIENESEAANAADSSTQQDTEQQDNHHSVASMFAN